MFHEKHGSVFESVELLSLSLDTSRARRITMFSVITYNNVTLCLVLAFVLFIIWLLQVMKIIDNVRPDRQTVMFSATFPRQMEALARRILTKPIEVQVGGRSVVCKDVNQNVVSCLALFVEMD
jgi:hypothetical protein